MQLKQGSTKTTVFYSVLLLAAQKLLKLISVLPSLAPERQTVSARSQHEPCCGHRDRTSQLPWSCSQCYAVVARVLSFSLLIALKIKFFLP